MKKVFDVIKSYVGNQKHMVEAYSGIGTFGLALLDQLKSCVMIESSKDNISMANDIKDKYHLDQVKIVHARAEQVIDEYDGDILLVDPPRQGLMKSFVDKILEMNFNQMIYVSCDVKTLARDISLLSDKYEVMHVHPIRMFHHTTSIETLIILKHKV